MQFPKLQYSKPDPTFFSLERGQKKCLRFISPMKLLDHCFKNLEDSPFFGPNIKRLKGGLEGSFRYQMGGLL